MVVAYRVAGVGRASPHTNVIVVPPLLAAAASSLALDVSV